MIFKQAFRVAFVALIWKQYKALIVSTVILLIFLLLVGNIHEDYLSAQKALSAHDATQGANTGMSFIYKWLAYIVGVVAYFGFHALRSTRNSPKDVKQQIKQAKKEAKLDSSDPFSAIRERENLRSRADFIDGKD